MFPYACCCYKAPESTEGQLLWILIFLALPIFALSFSHMDMACFFLSFPSIFLRTFDRIRVKYEAELRDGNCLKREGGFQCWASVRLQRTGRVMATTFITLFSHPMTSIFCHSFFVLLAFHFHCLCDGIVIEYNAFVHAINSGNGMEHADFHFSISIQATHIKDVSPHLPSHSSACCCCPFSQVH